MILKAHARPIDDMKRNGWGRSHIFQVLGVSIHVRLMWGSCFATNEFKKFYWRDDTHGFVQR